ncbi:MAG TPA: transcriptional regulator [Cytophagales bacterium]|jgi:HTH-type transcriptional regulator / antitoxin HigA|nr:transcriptional regulator [Cytophagales bacterium]
MIKPIKNNKQYNEALKAIYGLMQKDIKPETRESDNLEVLSILVKEYELAHFPLPKPNPIDAIKFRLEQLGMSESELSSIIGHRSRKSEILSGKRKLSLQMIRQLNKKLKIPAEVLIQAY